jgi:sugar O-acyltransferase (sialic acid O-acetyltransferase NeuD family)
MIAITIPQEDVNSDVARVMKWFVSEGEQIDTDQLLCESETTKAVIEINAKQSGIIHILVQETEEVNFNTPIAFLFNIQEEYESFIADIKNVVSKKKDIKKRATKKAIQLALQYGLDIDQFDSSSIINENYIRNYLVKNNLLQEQEVIIVRPGDLPVGNKKVLVIGGGFGAMQVIDILLHDNSVQVVGCVDDESTMKGNTIFNIPIVGTTNDIKKLFESRFFTHAIISISTNIQVRESLYNSYKKNGIPFVNAICPSVRINRNTVIGSGNVICSNVHIGLCTIIKNNNFISSNATIEHHNIIGSHNTWGPSFSTSSRVKIGNNNKFGINVSMQPGISIGNNCFIASGSVLIKNVPTDYSVKTLLQQSINPNQK